MSSAEKLLRELTICTETLLGYVPKWAHNTTLNVDYIKARVHAANTFLRRNGRFVGEKPATVLRIRREFRGRALAATITPAAKPLRRRRVKGADL